MSGNREIVLKRGFDINELSPGSPSPQTMDDCICNGLMSTETGKLIGTKLSFQMNHTSIRGTMMAAFVLDAMPVNTAFQSADISTPRVMF
ncbi:uncharacterized protein TNCV_1959011 [Trichonephila clavipes]|nr:uncharacterized protein TNCV_1959011 [Trichonephila clavipes]